MNAISGINTDVAIARVELRESDALAARRNHAESASTSSSPRQIEASNRDVADSLHFDRSTHATERTVVWKFDRCSRSRCTDGEIAQVVETQRLTAAGHHIVERDERHRVGITAVED